MDGRSEGMASPTRQTRRPTNKQHINHTLHQPNIFNRHFQFREVSEEEGSFLSYGLERALGDADQLIDEISLDDRRVLLIPFPGTRP
jgi:hypothetical protein